jgi:hypothetical protein
VQFNTARKKKNLNLPDLNLTDKAPVVPNLNLRANGPFVQNLEYKCPEDEAWYAVSINCGNHEGKYKGASYFDVHYEGLHRTTQVYSVNLKENNQVEEMRVRLQCKSCQLRYWMCNDVQTGTPICASFLSNRNKDPKYFDGVVKNIDTVVKKVP